MNAGQVRKRLVRGLLAAGSSLFRGARLTAAWARKKPNMLAMSHRIATKQSERNEVLQQIGRIMCARHLASPLQDEELATFCQSAIDLEAEVKDLRKRLSEMESAPLLAEDMGAGPLRGGPAGSEGP